MRALIAASQRPVDGGCNGDGLNAQGIVLLSRAASAYLNERRLGDEYRYVLDRQHKKRRVGNMLPRAGLLGPADGALRGLRLSVPLRGVTRATGAASPDRGARPSRFLPNSLPALRPEAKRRLGRRA